MFAAEARGLAWLAEAGALRVPAVVAASGASDVTPFLALELIGAAPPARDFDERLGRGLAALHRHGARALRPGPRQLHRPAAAGRTSHRRRHVGRVLSRAAPRSRSCGGRWTAGWRRRGCGAGSSGCSRALEDAVRAGRAAGAAARRSVGRQPASCDERGAPCLIDPAVYGGHREIDLAMMRLFGGLRVARVRRLRRGVAAGARATASACRSTSFIR